MICTLTADNWCDRHKMHHNGHYRAYALDEGEKGQRFRRHWDEQVGLARPNGLLRSLPIAKQCRHNNGENGTKKAGCGSCTTYACSLKGTVRLSECVNCSLFQPRSLQSERLETAAIRFDHTNLHPEIPGIRFNASIIESSNGYLYAFRNGWTGSRLFICRLDSSFQPIAGQWAKLELPTKGIIGHEDPRLFRLNGKLHCWYIAYGGRKTSVKFCRINEETLKVEDDFFPQIPNRNKWEKNISYFDYHGIAHAVYDTSPNHRILRIEGHQAAWAHTTPFKGVYSGGPIRGGASPVLHNGAYWHFFHGVTTYQGRRRYNTGVTVFRAEPPFDVLRYTPHPIDEADVERNHDCYCDCLFIGGALYKDGQWITANGDHDRWSTIRFYDAEWVESQLEDVA